MQMAAHSSIMNGAALVYLKKEKVQNFRSLRDLEVDIEDYLSIIVGRNNSGKTSLLLAMDAS